MPAVAPTAVDTKGRPASLVVDTAGRTGGGGRDDGVISGRDRVALGVAAGLPDRFEYACGGPTYGDGIGMLGRQRLDVGQHL